tara:strand:- start:102 stop:266 length:165 start_codon:yes stop_codon:yes gene_type:complete
MAKEQLAMAIDNGNTAMAISNASLALEINSVSCIYKQCHLATKNLLWQSSFNVS